MWSYDDILRRNPPEKGQRSSILSRLIQTRSATQELLCETSNDLEDRGQPFVCCFGQLPYPISVEPAPFVIRGSTRSVSLELEFRLFTTTVDSTGQLEINYIAGDEAKSAKIAGPLGTQVRAFVPVWGRRLVYYDGYLDCLHNEGLEDRIISTSAWDPDHAPAAYRGKVVTAHAFEPELASRIATELRYVLRKFLVAYSVVALEELPALNRVYGCFLLSAPGRVAYANPPEPVLAGLLNRFSFPTAVDKARIDQALQFRLRNIDGYLHQMLAMHRLAKQGEPRLAVVGCVTAIEWFMNSFVKREDNWSFSIKECLKKSPLSSLPEDLKRKLRSIADTRNDIVHGEPPPRRDQDQEHSPEQDPMERIAEVVRIGLNLYREINLRRLQPHVEGQPDAP